MKFYYYNINIVTSQPIPEKDMDKLWRAVTNIKTMQTAGGRTLTKRRWEKMMDVLNK